MNRKTLFAALGCALLAFSMLGCNALQTTNHLQSITLSNSNTVPNAGNAFTMRPGSPVQMYTWGTYSSGKVLLLHGGVAYQILSTPFGFLTVGPDGLGDPNATPPGTVQLSTDGLLTAITPPACSFVDVATTGTTPAFQTTGWFIVTATYSGQTTPPGAVYMATEGLPATATNPSGECGPPPASH